MRPNQNNSKAETAYRAAFERLKNNRPTNLPAGTPVTQNNVAKEAGVDPSALKKSRFPSLIAEIQHYLAENHRPQISDRQKNSVHRKKTRNLQERLADTVAQRDKLASLLNHANAQILALAKRLAQIEANLPESNVRTIDRRRADE